MDTFIWTTGVTSGHAPNSVIQEYAGLKSMSRIDIAGEAGIPLSPVPWVRPLLNRMRTERNPAAKE
jgi:hypothetical protein